MRRAPGQRAVGAAARSPGPAPGDRDPWTPIVILPSTCRKGKFQDTIA